MPRCARVESTWAKLAVQLAASREAQGLPRINVAAVDTSESVFLLWRALAVKDAPQAKPKPSIKDPPQPNPRPGMLQPSQG